MASDPISVRGLILRSREFKEKDRMVTVLTADRGIMTICVKGVSSKNSKNAFASVPFSLCDLVVNPSGNFNYLKEGSIIESNAGIMGSLEAMAVAGHISNILNESILQTENSHLAYELCVYAFYALGKFPERYAEIYCAFNWRILIDLGFASVYETEDGQMYYYISTEDSRISPYSQQGLFKISAAGLKALNFFASCRPAEVFNVTLNEVLQDELRRFTTQYMQNQFEYEIKDPIKRLENLI